MIFCLPFSSFSSFYIAQVFYRVMLNPGYQRRLTGPRAGPLWRGLVQFLWPSPAGFLATPSWLISWLWSHVDLQEEVYENAQLDNLWICWVNILRHFWPDAWIPFRSYSNLSNPWIFCKLSFKYKRIGVQSQAQWRHEFWKLRETVVFLSGCIYRKASKGKIIC